MIPFDEVPCRECGKTFRSVEYSHLTHKHGMDIGEYEEKYPDSPRICTQMLEKLGRTDEIWDTIMAYQDEGSAEV